jgi:hypothetical protein
MATYEETGKFCRTCQRPVMARRRTTNHVLQLLITVCTCGLWVIPWILMSIRFGGWRCALCGLKV